MSEGRLAGSLRELAHMPVTVCARACVWLAGGLAGLSGCTTVDLREFALVEPDVVAVSGPAGTHGAAMLPVRSGDIIVNEHPGAGALFVSLLSEDFSEFVHAGIVVVEDQPYVYESFGSYVPLPWRAPNARMGGGVRRVTLSSFLARGGIVSIHEPPEGANRESMVGFARARLAERKPFDGVYDLRDDTRYYCVEFVARALEHAGAAPLQGSPVSKNPSVRVALDWLGIETDVLLQAGALTAGPRVARVARSLSLSEVERYFALKRELHRRFTADQKLGNLLYWSWQRLRLRPQVDAFFERGVRGDHDIAVLADEMFGAKEERSIFGSRK